MQNVKRLTRATDRDKGVSGGSKQPVGTGSGIGREDRGGEEGCQDSINPSGQNRYDFHSNRSNQDNRNQGIGNQAHDVSYGQNHSD